MEFFALVCVAFIVPHLLYAFVWKFPKTFQAVIGKNTDPVTAFEAIAVILKLLQFLSFGMWYTYSFKWQWSADSILDYVRILLGAIFLLVGQLLNVAVFKALGSAGVYYGVKFGRKIPWCTRFPFNLGIRDPQYVGSVITFWGIALLLYTSHHRSGLLVLSSLILINYCASSFIERT